MGENRKTVLIIDDDANITRAFARILRKKGYAADIALSGEEAIQKAKEKFYSVALIDICLSDINGMELLSKLEQHDGRMVKIILTGFPTMASDTDVKPDAYLLKPVKPEDLLTLIDQKTKEP